MALSGRVPVVCRLVWSADSRPFVSASEDCTIVRFRFVSPHYFSLLPSLFDFQGHLWGQVRDLKMHRLETDSPWHIDIPAASNSLVARSREGAGTVGR